MPRAGHFFFGGVGRFNSQCFKRKGEELRQETLDNEAAPSA